MNESVSERPVISVVNLRVRYGNADFAWDQLRRAACRDRGDPRRFRLGQKYLASDPGQAGGRAAGNMDQKSVNIAQASDDELDEIRKNGRVFQVGLFSAP